MRFLLKKLAIKEEFVKNALTLTFGTSVAQFFPILFYPILGRLFEPEEFGLLASITSIIAILVVLSTGKYENCILIARTKQNAINIIGLVIILSTIILLISYFVLQLFAFEIGDMLGEPRISKWIFICPISSFSIIIYNCYNEWSVRNKYFVELSWNKIINAGATTLGKLFFGLIGLLRGGLVLGDFVGRLCSAATCIFRFYRRDGKILNEISFKEIKIQAKRYIAFPKYILPGQVLNTFGGQLPIILIGVYFMSTEVGYYSMTMNLLSVPVSVISMAIMDTFRQKANEDFNKFGNCISIYTKTFKFLLIIAFFGSIILIGALPWLFTTILGDQWKVAGVYSQILCPMIALSFISNSLSGVLIIAEKVKAIFLFQIYYFSSTLISLLIGGIYFKDPLMTLVCFSIGRSSAYLLEISLSYHYAQKKK